MDQDRSFLRIADILQHLDQGRQTTNDKATAYISALDEFGGIAGRTVGGQHYSTYQDKFHILGTCTDETEPGNPLSAKCSHFDLDYVPMPDPVVKLIQGVWKSQIKDASGRALY